MATSIIPFTRKKAKVVPLYKVGPVDAPDNYPAISILPIMSKLLERAVQTQDRYYLEERFLISKHQFGYQTNRSTQLATVLLHDEIHFEENDNNLAGTLFLDLNKAFDAISRSIVLTVLHMVLITTN